MQANIQATLQFLQDYRFFLLQPRPSSHKCYFIIFLNKRKNIL